MITMPSLHFFIKFSSVSLAPYSLTPALTRSLNMKKQILTAVILSSLSISAFALPQNNPQPLLGEMQDSSVKTLMGFGSNLQTEGGAERLQERLRVAESSADRTYKPQAEHMQVVESSADRTFTPQMEHLRVAESSADRTYKPQAERMQVAESSADRTFTPQMEHLRVAESSADRTYKPQIEHMQVAESSADRTYKPQTPGQTA